MYPGAGLIYYHRIRHKSLDWCLAGVIDGLGPRAPYGLALETLGARGLTVCLDELDDIAGLVGLPGALCIVFMQNPLECCEAEGLLCSVLGDYQASSSAYLDDGGGHIRRAEHGENLGLIILLEASGVIDLLVEGLDSVVIVHPVANKIPHLLNIEGVCLRQERRGGRGGGVHSLEVGSLIWG